MILSVFVVLVITDSLVFTYMEVPVINVKYYSVFFMLWFCYVVVDQQMYKAGTLL